jgi:hypothetical protein
MTYSELGYLQMIYAAMLHVDVETKEKERLSATWEMACKRFKLDSETAETICEALEE